MCIRDRVHAAHDARLGLDRSGADLPVEPAPFCSARAIPNTCKSLRGGIPKQASNYAITVKTERFQKALVYGAFLSVDAWLRELPPNFHALANNMALLLL